MRPDDTEMNANICSFKSMEVAINEILTIQSSRARQVLSCAVTERLEST